MTAPSWQDLVAASAALVAGVWLFRRWLAKRRARAGCDTCAAAMHARLKSAEQTSKQP